ncbi:serine/threonine protein kinase [Verrucomicrobiaceae bacterium 5K15]|uniref:Serine/threonine protein kinase n=1 Tax=Oceaniferula flava TaxID=2800421 RepID=A0AAE2S9W3_9BACT|nr:serine/threonine-protein kinase [Oceaniferula flavus]MBK1854041.1 serine/threonine protein kinase [Oceaniferula flavus]MBM1135347.1 serine/threonine protein kinase [Oceaniferula flavus]
MTTLEQPIRLEPVELEAAASEPRYTILETLENHGGGNGLAVVNRAHDEKLDREVSVKRLLPTMPEVSHTLRVEALMLAAVNHPNIISIYDVYETDNRVCIVMESLRGQSLDQVFAKGKFSVEDLTTLMFQTQSALASAESSGIVHGDLNPHNILQTVNEQGELQYKLLDFDQSIFAKTKMPLESHYAAYGSIYCMAPERFEGTAPSTASDTYAMGCIYYLALTGTFPCTGAANIEIMASHLRGQITPLQELRPDLPEWLCQWVHWLLARNPKERPQSPKAVKESYLELMQRFTSSPEKFLSVLDSPTHALAQKEIKTEEVKTEENDSWVVARGTEIGGPHTWENVINYLYSGSLLSTDLIKNDAMDNWVLLGELVESRMATAG